MEEICRFCLKVSVRNMCSLQECDILSNIQRFITIQIPTDDSFPNKLCKDCFKKISEIIKFCLTVEENEDELQKYYQNGELQDYYARILENNIREMEIEPRECVETWIVKTEDSMDDFETSENLENKVVSDATYCSSDDRIIFPSIKLEKAVNNMTDTARENKEVSDATYCSFNHGIIFSSIKLGKEVNKITDTARENKEVSDATYCSSDDGIIFSSIKLEKEVNKITDTARENKELSDATYCSSNNGIMFSSPKKEKKINNTIDAVTEPNNILKVKPIKYLRNDSRRRQKLDPDSVEYLKQFTCLMCLKPCDSHSNLIDHYYVKHMNESLINKSYTVLKSGSKTEYTCKVCEQSFKLKRQIVKHVFIHTDDRPLSCKICARTYRTVPEIVRHARAHNGFKYQCPFNCGFTSAYQGAMKEHERRHLDQYKYNCEICGKGFNTKTWYDQHQNIHKGLKPFVCDICGIGFPMTRYLQHHKYSSHPQSSDLKRYSCIHCDEKCDSAKSLSVHMLEHGIKKDTHLLCHFCGKVLSTDYQLQYHQRMHAGIKPHSCPICKKTFAKKYNVQLHMSIHTGEKAHACGRCGKQYSQRSTLLRHLKIYHASTTDVETET